MATPELRLMPITISPITGNGKYADVIKMAKALAKGELGTPANAIAVMCRESNLYRKATNGGRLKQRRKQTA